MFQRQIKGLCLLLLVSSAFTASAQWKFEWPKIELGKNRPPINHFLIAGGGLGELQFVDKLTSPRIYEGIAAGGFLAYERQAPRSLWVSDFTGNFADTYDDAGDWAENNAQSIVMRSHHAIMLPLRAADDRWQLYLGPAMQTYSSFRINTGHGNNAVMYDAGWNVGGKTRLEYSIPLRTKQEYKLWIFRLKKFETRKLRIGWDVDLSALGWQFRPPYNGILAGVGNDPIGAGVEDVLNNSRISVIGGFLYVNSTAYVRYPLRNGNRFQLSYNWFGYSYNYLDQPVRQASGLLMGSFVFRLDAKEEVR
ncbi:MAG: hypothetical protein C0424_07885 [Sphingobacteriaceae bacterium]|nr:hypothetical protein [Sphingobacteriaceae bacterium]